MTKEAILRTTRALGLFSVVAGGLGIVACMPYVALDNWIIVGAAGIVCVAAAIIYVGGLLTVAYLIEK